MTDDDRNLLERAARAAGYKPVRLTDDGTALLLEGEQDPWNSLDENADALGLAFALDITVGPTTCRRRWQASHRALDLVCWEPATNEDAARRAITRVAAELTP